MTDTSASTTSNTAAGDGSSPNQDGNKPTSASTSDAGDEKTITMTSQQLAERLARAKPADYDDLKTKAAKLAEIEDAQKTEAQKAADALATQKRRADQAEAKARALGIATEFKLGADDAALLAELSDETAQRKLAERLAAQQNGEQPGRVGYSVDHSSTQSSPPPNKDDAARAFFGI